MESIGQLDEDDADVVGHGQQHLWEGLSIRAPADPPSTPEASVPSLIVAAAYVRNERLDILSANERGHALSPSGTPPRLAR